MAMETEVVILAAGKGTRMRSALPKVLHCLAGKPLLQHVFDCSSGLDPNNTLVVVGHGADQVRKRFEEQPCQWFDQTEQQGTAHAVAQVLPALAANSKVLILYGDVPLLQGETVAQMLKGLTKESLALLTVNLDDPNGYGRILRGADGKIQGIVEHKDANNDQRQLKEVNTGIMAVMAEDLRKWLPKIDNQNAQKEYYLTDIVALARKDGYEIRSHQPADYREVEGINSRGQLATLERYYQQTIANSLLDQGVTLADPSRFDCRGSLVTGTDVFIDINAVFEGEVSLGDHVTIGANCVIKDAKIGDHVYIKPYSVIEGPVEVAEQVEIGPFARVRPHTRLGVGARVGNFVETKKAEIGPGSKINHLSYVGDSKIGEAVNIGAGTITCNYDGVNKHVTEIGDSAFIGSNSSLVAPVRIGAGATVGAGSTITKEVDADTLAIARGKQVAIKNWQRPVKKGGSKTEGS